MEKIKQLFFTFTTVTTCTVAGAAIYLGLFHRGANIGTDILIQILFVSLATSLGVFLYPDREICKKEILARTLIHYVYVNIIVLGCGLWFDWYRIDNMAMIIGMLLLIAAIFLIVSLLCWKKAEREIALINKKLKEYQDEREK